MFSEGIGRDQWQGTGEPIWFFIASVLQPAILTLHSAKILDNVFCKAPEFDTFSSSFVNDIF